ncbi:MAG: asparagine--tRNA ligase [Ekhidna sp.]|nr:asparagine--tRNA ligase [Ekhidna sp.]MBC6410152.1 asparagine--tRNA ligase [Ekhidna sp.]MBC6425955.1 asparagine--tRNA ligase [Ekhidna sp.]
MNKVKRTKIRQILAQGKAGEDLCVKGWVRNRRGSKNVTFVALNDGSTINNLQLVFDRYRAGEDTIRRITTGAGLSVAGTLQESQGAGQAFELIVKEVEVLGEADPERYPLQPKKHSMEFLREIAHLRPRTNTFGAVLRIRHEAAYALHTFFHEKGFYYLNAPILTTSDAEGAGETFKVTTLNLENVPKNESGDVDFKQDFFEKETNLTVSGQLEGELAALAVGEIYTFGPTFRAENSNTTRHLAEFWMVEPEMAFYDLEDNMALAEEMLKYTVKHTLENCADDLAFLNKRQQDEEKSKPQNERNELSLVERLQFVAGNDFERLTYSDAIEILKRSKPNQKKKFQYPVEGWGVDLQSDHERFLVEKHFKKPMILYDYPKNIKAFYMRRNEDDKTVAAMDILFPGIGEIVGGSQREERLDKLEQRMAEMNIPSEALSWYLDTRRFGTVPHSGYGLGFERMIQFLTGMSNIRDVIPFPRTPGNCEF